MTVETKAARGDSAVMQRTNPFPGMNPFMEQRWGDCHHTLMGCIRRDLGSELPDTYSAVVEEAVSVVGSEASGYRPDVAIVGDSWKQGVPETWNPALNTEATAPVIVEVEEIPERWIEIRHDSGELVSVIEIISPTNRESGREDFLRKRRDFVAAGVNVVEIDLIRGGQRLIDMQRKEYVKRFGSGNHYTICTIRARYPKRREIYCCTLKDRLPIFRVPLRYPDPDVTLDLQKLVDEVYATGRYWKLDYQSPLDTPLTDDESAWVAERLSAAGLSPAA